MTDGSTSVGPARGNTFLRPHINLGCSDDDRRDGSVNSLPALVEFAAKHNPDHIFGLQARNDANEVRGLSWSKITFGQFQRRVEYASAWLVESNVAAGRVLRSDSVSPVAIFLSSDITIFMYLVALLRIGTPALLLSPRLPPVSVAHLLRETRTSVVLTGAHLVRTVDESRAILLADENRYDFRIINAPSFFDVNLHQRCDFKTPPVYTGYEYNDLDAVIMHTSGSTGLPKPIYHAQAYLLLYATCHRLPPERGPFKLNFSTLPLYHGFGLLAPCLSLSIGMPFALLSSISIPTASSTLVALRGIDARYLMTVPSIIGDILRCQNGEGLAILRQLDFLVIGGAQVKVSVLQDLVQARIKVLNHWGTTETGSITPIECPWTGYDGRYVVPRTDANFRLVRTNDGSGTFRLIARPPGWKEHYVVPDLLAPNPNDQKQLQILGRVDDLLVLATGEKVRPAAVEREIAGHPCVNDALVFGDGRFQLGIIVELKKSAIASNANPDSKWYTRVIIAQLRLDTFIQKGNDLVERHGKIAEEMVILTMEDVKPLKRTEKGSLARRESYHLFAKEIKRCYEISDVERALPFPMPWVEGGIALKRTIRSLVREVGVHSDGGAPNDLDFLQAGMDSLQAARLQNMISIRLRAVGGTSSGIGKISTDFVFDNSSVDKLYLALSSILAGTYANSPASDAAATREERRIAAMNAMVEKYKHILGGFRDTAVHSKSRPNLARVARTTKTILLTGSTGSLGCFLLLRLVKDPIVSKVICLNRSFHTSLRTRQREQMKKRGIRLSGQEWAKVIFLDCNLNDGDLSLDAGVAKRLLEVTYIVHNAWPVTFNWTLSSFEPHVRGVVNLMRIAWRSAQHRGGRPVRFIFISSIAAVGKYPLLHTSPCGASTVPERVYGPGLAIEIGYAEAKWVCEKLISVATKMSNGSIRGCCVRIGQMTGSEESGVWNEKEHFPTIIRMSRTLGALPLLEGSLSWMPVDRAAFCVVELLLSQRFLPVYHIENPCRQPWKEVMQAMTEMLCKSLGQSEIALISYAEWLRRVRRLGNEPENVAFPLLVFFEKDFLRLATGGVVLDTSRATEDSITMATSRPIGRMHLEQYVAYWQSIGVL